MPSVEDFGIPLVDESGSGRVITRNCPLSDTKRSVLSANLTATPAPRNRKGGSTTVYSMASSLDRL